MSEPWMIQVLEGIIPISKGKFIDVGVNIGQTMVKLRSVSSSMEYIGFEPNPICFNYVNYLVKANRFENITLLPIGVSSEDELGMLYFYSDSEVDSSASMIHGFRNKKTVTRREFIPLFSANTICKNLDLSKMSILKIDVEGAELEVIKGFYAEIKKSRPIVLMEILPAYSNEFKDRIDRQIEIVSLFLNAEYQICRFNIKDQKLLVLERIEEIEIHSDLNACEYMMLPEEKVEPIEQIFTIK